LVNDATLRAGWALAQAALGEINMTELQAKVQSTLMAEHNQASVSAMLNAILEKPLTPMEANQAKTYMEQVASQAADAEGAEVQLFQLMEMKNQHTTYVMRVALFSNNKAIGLDVMDAENGQFFVPDSCPVVELEAATLN
jgi:hypothetical protein